MSNPHNSNEEDDDLRVADEVADHVRTFLMMVDGVASGDDPDTAIPRLLLATSQILAVGARLGAMADVVPPNRFEPDSGPDAEFDSLLDGLEKVLTGVNEYVDVLDPMTTGEIVSGSIANDIAEVSSALTHGLNHLDNGYPFEALWWWQFSYLSAWGERAASAVRTLHSILSHVRLDVEEDVASEAQFDALHT